MKDTNYRFYSGLICVASLWLMISPWVLGQASGTVKWTQIFFGFAAAATAIYRHMNKDKEWPAGLGAAIGLWLIVSPYLLDYDNAVVYWNQVVAGLIIAALFFAKLDIYGENSYQSF